VRITQEEGKEKNKIDKNKKKKEREERRGGKRRTGQNTFVPGLLTTRYKYSHLYRVSRPVQMRIPHLYRRTCTGSIPGTNEGYTPVQMSVFPVVMQLLVLNLCAY
jgi:hypothetical protein